MRYVVKIRGLPDWLEEMYKTGKLKRTYRFNKILIIQKGRRKDICAMVKKIEKEMKKKPPSREKKSVIRVKVNNKSINVTC